MPLRLKVIYSPGNIAFSPSVYMKFFHKAHTVKHLHDKTVLPRN